jgi:hypothetical protein
MSGAMMVLHPAHDGRSGAILNDRVSSLPPERREPIVRAVPLGRIGTPEDVRRRWCGLRRMRRPS